MNRRLLMTPDLLARKRAEILTDTAYEGRWRSLKRVAESNAMTESSREWLPTLAAMSLLTDEPKYAARAEVLLASAVNSGYTLISADRGKPVGQEVFQLAIAYDWLGDRLSPDMLARAGATLAAWGKWIWPETNFARVGAWGIDAPWDNYHHEFIRGSWLAGLAIGDDALIALSRQKWAKALAWLQEHQPSGFFCEGSTYGNGSFVSILEALCANKTATGEELPPWCGGALDCMFQLTTPGMGGKLPYGDNSSDYKAIHSDTDRLAAMLMGTFGGRALGAKGWLDNIVRNRSKRAQSLWSEFVYYQSDPRTWPYAVPSFYTDKGAGYIDTRSSGLDKAAVQVSAACGPTFSTHQNAAGGFLAVRGNDFLVGFANQWSASGLQHGAEFVNCPLVDGRGQDNMQDRTAHVTHVDDNEKRTIWQMEAGQAYDFSVTSSNRIKPLKSWRRSIVFLKPGAVIVHDRIEKNDPKSVVTLPINTHKMPLVTAPLGLVEGTSALYIHQVTPMGIPAIKPLLLGPASAVSSFQTIFQNPPGQPVDEFLMVYQVGANGFSPLPVASTDQGVEIGDDEFIFEPDGTVEYLDHRVSPRDQALFELHNHCVEWDHLWENLDPQADTVAQAVITSARALIKEVDGA